MKVRPAILIIENDSVLLMQYRYGHTDVYNLPGGNPDPNETLSETLIRELEEELLIKIEVEKLVLMGEVLSSTQGRADVLHCVFAGKIVSGIPTLNPDQTSAIALVWKPIAALDTLAMYPQVGVELKNIIFQNTDNQYIGTIKQVWY